MPGKKAAKKQTPARTVARRDAKKPRELGVREAALALGKAMGVPVEVAERLYEEADAESARDTTAFLAACRAVGDAERSVEEARRCTSVLEKQLFTTDCMKADWRSSLCAAGVLQSAAELLCRAERALREQPERSGVSCEHLFRPAAASPVAAPQ